MNMIDEIQQFRLQYHRWSETFCFLRDVLKGVQQQEEKIERLTAELAAANRSADEARFEQGKLQATLTHEQP